MGTTITNLLKTYGLPTHRPPTSPGETVLHFLQDVEMSQAEAARGLGITANRLNEHELRRSAQTYGAIHQRRPRAVRDAAAHATV